MPVRPALGAAESGASQPLKDSAGLFLDSPAKARRTPDRTLRRAAARHPPCSGAHAPTRLALRKTRHACRPSAARLAGQPAIRSAQRSADAPEPFLRQGQERFFAQRGKTICQALPCNNRGSEPCSSERFHRENILRSGSARAGRATWPGRNALLRITLRAALPRQSVLEKRCFVECIQGRGEIRLGKYRIYF